MPSCRKIAFLLLFLFATINLGQPVSGVTEAFSIRDYLTFEPGHYIQLRDTEGRTVELVYQNSAPNSYLLTLTKVGNSGPYWRNSAMFRIENSAGSVSSTWGCPTGNQANFFSMIWSMPAGFLDGARAHYYRLITCEFSPSSVERK